MTDDIDTEEEIIENNNQEPLQNGEDEPQIPIISSADQVEPLEVLELYERALLLLHLNADEEDSYYMNSLYSRHFGEKYTKDDVNSSLADERQQAVVTDYIRDRLDYTKMASTCLSKKKIDKAFENIFSLVGLNINISNSVEELYDEIFAKRAGKNVFLLEDYEVLKLNRQTWHIYNDKTDITELSGIITAMEDLAISIDDNKDDPDFKIVDDEVLAQFYYNVSEIYDSEANRKSNMPDVNKWHYRAMEYKKKALDLTSLNIIMVTNIQNDWSEFSDYNHKRITNACERIIGNREASDRDKFRAHKLCADTLMKLQKIDGFIVKNERIDDAVTHYRNALAYVTNKKDKIDILRRISKAQKNEYPNEFISTRLEIIELLEGRAKISEYSKLAQYVTEADLKANLFKSAINEFHELPNIDIEDRNMYDNIDKSLRQITPPEDKETLKTLDKLKKKYGNKNHKDTKLLFPMMSSGGHDYFIK